MISFLSGTNMISELFSTMTSRMRFTDVWNLVLGNTVGPRISEARQSATDYLRFVKIEKKRSFSMKNFSFFSILERQFFVDERLLLKL